MKIVLDIETVAASVNEWANLKNDKRVGYLTRPTCKEFRQDRAPSTIAQGVV